MRALGPSIRHLIVVLAAGAVLVGAPAPAAENGFASVADPSTRIRTAASPISSLPEWHPVRVEWGEFRAARGPDWRAWIDRRTGVPILVEGSGVPLFDDGRSPRNLSDVERAARQWVGDNETLVGVRHEQIELNERGSGQVQAGHWVLVFGRRVDGIPVENQRFTMYVTHGRLTAFGAENWGEVGALSSRVLGVDQARRALESHLGLVRTDRSARIRGGTLVLVPGPVGTGPYEGPVGKGLRYRAVRRFVIETPGRPGAWVGKVGAVTGEIVALYDTVRDHNVTGGVFTYHNDGTCPEGCEQASSPLPFSDVDIDGQTVTAGSFAQFGCDPAGALASTELVGPFVHIDDACGAISESTACEADLELGDGAGTDCVAAGSSPGNTHASRTSFYHSNRAKQKSRSWLPDVEWLDEPMTVRVNEPGEDCGGTWDGTGVTLYRSGADCRNGGENPGTIVHEFGHGLDDNDGGGADNPYEAYADIVEMLENRRSCLGRGLSLSQNCTGYGDTCLDCTGVREADWDKRVEHTPATPQVFVNFYCFSDFDGPCGGMNHCEAYVLDETIYDLATRDLPAMGLDAESSWQLVEKLFYGTRLGSGGNAYNCALPASDSCGAGTWFTKFRSLDDDDGNLANGTPHAAAIFAAFDRHNIACGMAADASNQNFSGCPALATPSVSVGALSGAASLTWAPVAGAERYLVRRNEVGCDYSSNLVASVVSPDTGFLDTGLANAVAVYYRVQAQGANPACESAVSACVPVTPVADAGSVRLGGVVQPCDGTVEIFVQDENAGSPTVNVELFSDSEPLSESVLLSESSSGSGRFAGSMDLVSAPAVAGDNAVSVQHADTLTVRYVDADDGMGGSNLTREHEAAIDCIVPSITATQAASITDTSAEISWSTDETTTTHVRYGELAPPDRSKRRYSNTVAHRVTPKDLQECTVYRYAVESSDGANLAVDDDAGQYHTFETLGDFGEGLGSCRTATLLAEQPLVGCSSVLPLRAIDLDLNLDPTSLDTAVVQVTSSTETEPETVMLTETGPNTAQFTAEVPTSSGAPIAADGVLQTAHGDILTASLVDLGDESGERSLAYDTADADCAGPSIAQLTIADLTEESALVSWTTQQPATARLEWGTTPALGTLVVADDLQTAHALTMHPLDPCARYFFRVTATDAAGNVTVADELGIPFEFNANEIPGLVFKEGFESASGWTLEGEWEIGAPQGLGSNPPDPVAAFRGTLVLGHDLSGQGQDPGNYEHDTEEAATSPIIDASSLSNGVLRFRRWLNVQPNISGAFAAIDVHDGTDWFEVWTQGGFIGELDWSDQSVDISAFADGNPDLRIRFRQSGGLSFFTTMSGWNVDRLFIKDGSAADFQACGGCLGAPTFAGIESAVDADPCSDSGIDLHWQPAPAWGSGGGGTYAVYRDTSAGFTPSAANRLASGISGTTWSDTDAPNDVPLHYLVEAENDETCGTGPNNGGLTSGQAVYATAQDETVQPPPDSPQASLVVDPVNAVHVRLSWAAAAGAATYNVYRADAPQGPFTQIGVASDTRFEDREELVGPSDRFYNVRGADACGNEGP